MADVAEGPGGGGVDRRPCRGGRGGLSQGGRFAPPLAEFWPEFEGARDLALDVHAKYPRVVVGVCGLEGGVFPTGDGMTSCTDWAARREAGLDCRMLSDSPTPAPEGGT